MADKYKVLYNIRVADKASELFGVLVEKSKHFNSLQEAMKFIRNNPDIVGKPVLVERN